MTQIFVKIILLLHAITLAGQAIACVCSHTTFTEKYMWSDFVARAKITKTYVNEGSKMYYKSDIVIQDLYKGDPATFVLVEGSSDGKKRTSCDIFIPENTELLIYARKNDQGQYIFNSCSGYLILDHSRPATQDREIAMLDLLKAKNINFTDKTSYWAHFADALKGFTSVNLDKNFGIYEVTFAFDLRVKSVSTIDGFNPELDGRLIRLLKQAKWGSTRFTSEGIIYKNSIPEDSKVLFGFYYYKAAGGYESFIGQYDL
jgi:hypothetical protein